MSHYGYNSDGSSISDDDDDDDGVDEHHGDWDQDQVMARYLQNRLAGGDNNNNNNNNNVDGDDDYEYRYEDEYEQFQPENICTSVMKVLMELPFLSAVGVTTAAAAPAAITNSSILTAQQQQQLKRKEYAKFMNFHWSYSTVTKKAILQEMEGLLFDDRPLLALEEPILGLAVFGRLLRLHNQELLQLQQQACHLWSPEEITKICVGVSKLLEEEDENTHNNKTYYYLRRMAYLVLQDVVLPSLSDGDTSENTIAVTDLLTWDMANQSHSFHHLRANAIRLLPFLWNTINASDDDLKTKKFRVQKLLMDALPTSSTSSSSSPSTSPPLVRCAALVAMHHLVVQQEKSPNNHHYILKTTSDREDGTEEEGKNNNDIQNQIWTAVKDSPYPMVQYHALQLLLQMHANNQEVFQKTVMDILTSSVRITSPLSLVVMIRCTEKLLLLQQQQQQQQQQQPRNRYDDQPQACWTCTDFLMSNLQYKRSELEMVQYEAARAICNLHHHTVSALVQPTRTMESAMTVLEGLKEKSKSKPAVQMACTNLMELVGQRLLEQCMNATTTSAN